MKLAVGMKMPEFIYSTAYEKDASYLTNIKGQKAVISFLRYYG